MLSYHPLPSKTPSLSRLSPSTGMSIPPGPAHSTRLHPFNTILSSFKVLPFQKAITPPPLDSVYSRARSFQQITPLPLYQTIPRFFPSSQPRPDPTSSQTCPFHPIPRENHPPFQSAGPGPTPPRPIHLTPPLPRRPAPSTRPDSVPNVSTSTAPQGTAPFPHQTPPPAQTLPPDVFPNSFGQIPATARQPPPPPSTPTNPFGSAQTAQRGPGLKPRPGLAPPNSPPPVRGCRGRGPRLHWAGSLY